MYRNPNGFSTGCLLLLILAFSPAVRALPTGFVEQTIGGTWTEVVGVTFASDGRMFVWERGGRIWRVVNGVKQSPPLLDISDEVGGWRDYGLLGVALHPAFLTNGHIYLLYVVDHHHLAYAGTPSYNPATNEYFMATVGRITRYTARAADGFTSIDPASRFVLVGESASTGFPILHQSHGVGGLVFGTDGALLASCGDGASYSATDTGGGAGGTYSAQGLAEGIIRPKEDVGAYRSQLVDCLNGKVVRIDPMTGDGIPSNPFYVSAEPRAARSRVWALGLRNPCRIALRPGTGSHDRNDGDPGSIYIGDVGWGTWEDLHVCTGPGRNFGWPAFEGLEVHSGYWNSNTYNRDAPNPLFGTGGCTQEFFYFRNLIQQDTLNPNPSFPNPCNTSVQVPSGIPKFLHARPALDWRHGQVLARTGVYSGNNATVMNVGAAGSPVAGSMFAGNCSIGGVWYTGDDFPSTYKNTYFQADYGSGWIQNFVFDPNDKPVQVRSFHTGGTVVALATHPIDGELYYVRWPDLVYRVSFPPSGNQPPQAVAAQDLLYGPTPLTIQFQGNGSSDPESGPLTHSWNFGDGSPLSSATNPVHVFTAPAGIPTRYDVTLTVTDSAGASDQAALIVSVNNTPPSVTITSPTDGTRYPLSGDTTYNLAANISDAEHGPAQRTCEWQTTLHHNDHAHLEPVDPNCATTAVISPLGCDEETYYYRLALTVTDSAGLSTTRDVRLYPDCPNAPPVAVADLATVAQGYSVVIDVLANDRDPDGSLDPTSVAIAGPAIFGSTAIEPLTGTITYTHGGYAGAGSDSFSYTVRDMEGSLSNAAAVSISAFNNPPTVTLVSPADRLPYQSGDSIPLQATASDPEDGAAVGFRWEIQRLHNDHLETEVFVSTSPNPPAFDVPAHGSNGDRISYLFLATVTDRVGASASARSLAVPVSPPPNQPPVALFSVYPSKGSPPLVIAVDGGVSSDPDGDHLLHKWDFGDGTVGYGPFQTHSYAAPGIRYITLTVADSAGATQMATEAIEVLPQGLKGEYFDNSNMTGLVLTRIDSTVDFDWGTGSPAPAVGADTFSIRWSGQIEPLYGETYTFYALTDDGFRMWIGGVQVINSWIDQSPTERTGTIALQGGVKSPITIEYYENGGGATARLSWSSASQPKQIVPATALSPPPPANIPPVVMAGADRAVTTGLTVHFEGHVTDDGLPDPPGTLSVQWSSVSGPAAPQWPLADAGDLHTHVVFPTAGAYVLRLSVDDGAGVRTDDVSVTAADFDPCAGETEPPEAPCPGEVRILALTGCEAVVPDIRSGVLASDNCTAAGDLILVQSPAAGSLVAPGSHTITVTATDGAGNSASCQTPLAVEHRGFVRGNINNRGARVLDLGDVIDLVNYLFGGYVPPFNCEAALDVSNDGRQDITDVVAIVQGVFGTAGYVIPPPNRTEPGPGVPGTVVPDGGTIASVLGCAQGEPCP